MSAAAPVDRPLALGRWLRVAAWAVAAAAAVGAVAGGVVAAVVVPALALGVTSRVVWLSGRWFRDGDRGGALRAAALAALCSAAWAAALL